MENGEIKSRRIFLRVLDMPENRFFISKEFISDWLFLCSGIFRSDSWNFWIRQGIHWLEYALITHVPAVIIRSTGKGVELGEYDNDNNILQMVWCLKLFQLIYCEGWVNYIASLISNDTKFWNVTEHFMNRVIDFQSPELFLQITHKIQNSKRSFLKHNWSRKE